MFKMFLCLRYLRTRHIALASIISVTLGVATMIVVNSVMEGFQNEMHKRLHGILSDVVIDAHSLEGIEDPVFLKTEVEKVVGAELVGMTATVHVPAMLSFRSSDQWVTRQVNLIGIDQATYSQVSDFGSYLLHPENRRRLDFQLYEDGYDPRMSPAGWQHRRARVTYERVFQERMEQLQRQQTSENVTADQSLQPHETDLAAGTLPQDPFSADQSNSESDAVFDEMSDVHTGIILGISIASVRGRDASGQVTDYFLCRPGDDVKVTLPSAGAEPKIERGSFTVMDLYESKMSEYDASFAFVPLDQLQHMRGMVDPQTGIGAVTSLQIKLREGADLNVVRDKLRDRFPAHEYAYRIQTWRDMQGPLLAAVQMETAILNILLFLIIAVAGFGILATFFMIVVEKTRDIGILKSLGAPSRGIMAIFLSYGCTLGAVGAGVGMLLGILFVININRIASVLERITGREVFDPAVYYFQEIPTILDPLTIGWIVTGAMLIAVLASVLPAIRAARLHPVEALRYE